MLFFAQRYQQRRYLSQSLACIQGGKIYYKKNKIIYIYIDMYRHIYIHTHLFIYYVHIVQCHKVSCFLEYVELLKTKGYFIFELPNSVYTDQSQH